MRRFAFESDIYETLSCIPMLLREKLDRAAIKISLEQWLMFELTERRWLCECPIDTAQSVRKFTHTIRELVRKHCGGEPSYLSLEQQRAAFPTEQLPERIAVNARILGFEIRPKSWTQLDDEQRYALLKLGGGQRVKRNFDLALREFLRFELDSASPLGTSER